MTTSAQAVRENWPELPLAHWQDTYATLHMWTQIVGKIRLELGGQQVDMKATCEGPSIPAGAEVVITDVRDDVACVAPARATLTGGGS